MSVRIKISNIEGVPEPVFVDVHHRLQDGTVFEHPLRTHEIGPNEEMDFTVSCAQVLVVREGPEIVRGEG